MNFCFIIYLWVKKMNKDKILEILKVRSGEIVSGGFIANKLNISRNAVWKNINLLKNEGYDISSIKNRGYMLNSDISYLNKEEIEKYLNTILIGRELEITESIDSTLNYFKNMENSEKREGRTIIANEQTLGRGRRGRSFFSPKNSNAYISVLLKPKFSVSDINLITIICGLSVVEAVKEICGIECDIKWVNDVYINGKKICGILTEGILSVENGSIDSVIIGVGININRPKDTPVPKEIEDIVGFVNDFTKEKENRNKFIAKFLNAFEKRYINFDKKALYLEYKEKMLYLNEEVTCFVGNETIQGTLIDLNKDFSIKIKTNEGEIRNFNSGEISLRKKGINM